MATILLAALELELLGIGRCRANQGYSRRKQLCNRKRHFLISLVAQVQVFLRRPQIADSCAPHILLILPQIRGDCNGAPDRCGNGR